MSSISQSQKNYDSKTVETFLTSLRHTEFDGCTEIRILSKERYIRINGHREYVGNTVAGYYTDYAQAARDIATFDGKVNIYATLNPCDPKLMRRAHNRLEFNAKATASDKDITEILWFPFDTDPVRPADTPSSDDELQAALDRRDRIIREAFEPYSVPVIRAMSGNGGHGLIPLIGYPNNEETQVKIKRLLDWLKETYSDDTVSVDSTVANPARIWKVYGTLACKGDNTPEAPYRRAFIEFPNEPIPSGWEGRPHTEPFDLLAIIDQIVPANFQSADESAKKNQSTTRTINGNGDYPTLDVDRYLNHYGYSFSTKQKNGRMIYILDCCPFNSDHNRGEVCITQEANGKLGFKCFHNSCSDKGWKDAKVVIGDAKPFYHGFGTQKGSSGWNGSGKEWKSSGNGNTPAKISMEGVLSEISQLDDKSPASVQKRLWDFVEDASYWNHADLGRFRDTLTTEYQITKTWTKDWTKAVHVEKRKRWALGQSAPQTSNGNHPIITTTDRHMRDVTADARAAIEDANNGTPFLFVRSGLPTRVEVDENGNVIAKPLTASAMRGIMERTANFMSENSIEGEPIQKPVNPPFDIVNDFLSLGSYPDLPPLIGVSTAPIVASDGTICSDVGYQPKTRYFYHESQKLEIGDTTPTPENIEKAKDLIWGEMLGDFPFVDGASKANAIALLLNPFVRPLIDGATPLYAIDASTPGTGKSLLADVATMVFAPNGAKIMTAGRNDDEWRKRITAKLMTASSHILIDNVKGKLTSGDLAAALTVKNEWEDRLLGTSTTVRMPVRCTWIATGNNLEFSDEIARRTVWMRMDAKVERPWKRTGFKHPDLRKWVSSHRAEIVTALLTWVRKWVSDGKPESDITLGGYEQWSHVVGGILKAVGIEGFMANADELYDQLDTERQAWVEFFSEWAEKFGAFSKPSNTWGAWVENGDGRVEWVPSEEPTESVGTKELFPLASTYDNEEDGEGLGLLDGHLGKGNERARRNYLGKLLANRYKDRVFGGYRLEVLDKTKDRAKQFRMVNLTPVDFDTASPTQSKEKNESTPESNDFDSFSQKTSYNAGSDDIQKRQNESNESKTTLSRDEEKTPYTYHTLGICDSRSSEDEPGFDSFDSFDSSSGTQEASRDAGSSRDESKFAKNTFDSSEGDERTEAIYATFINQCLATHGENSFSPSQVIPIAQSVGFDLTANNLSPNENIQRILNHLKDRTLNSLRATQNQSGTWYLQKREVFTV